MKTFLDAGDGEGILLVEGVTAAAEVATGRFINQRNRLDTEQQSLNQHPI